MDHRPSTPNMVMYDDEPPVVSVTSSRPGTGVTDVRRPATAGSVAEVNNVVKRPDTAGSLAPPDAMIYQTPPDSSRVVSPVGTAGKGIWTIEGEKEAVFDDSDDGDESIHDVEDDTRILLEKEFDDFYEDRVHKSTGPVVFVSKTLGLLPVIWTEDESESECKSYFNLYTFIIFIGWIGLAVISGIRMGQMDDTLNWPGEQFRAPENLTNPKRFLTKTSMDVYLSATWVASLITLIFGVFKCRSFAEVLFGLSEVDAQLELQEKHYDKIKRKSLYWIIFLLMLLGLHVFAFYTILNDCDKLDPIFFLADILAHMTISVLDLQFLHFSMVLCKRYRLVNKILLHITKPWKTFRQEQPSNIMVQNILQYRFDQFFDPGQDPSLIKQDIAKKDVPLEMLIKNQEDPKVSKEEEGTFVLQMDILRGIHADLNALAHEVNHLLGFQILISIITSVVFVIMYGYFFSAALMDNEFYWPYLVLGLLPAVRIFLIGHWGQVLEQQSRQPFMTICQVSTVDGSPRLERQVQKLTVQMHHQCPQLTAAGYFTLGRNMILKTIGCAVVFTFFMVKFQNLSDLVDGTAATKAMMEKQGEA